MSFSQWLRTALPGATYSYHFGLLMADRQIASDAAAVDTVGKLAWRAYEAGRVALTQRRTEHGCLYVATRL